MAWNSKLSSSSDIKPVDQAISREYDSITEKGMPVIGSESDRPFEPVSPQPVISPGIYEGEFLVKEPHVIFHFWPYGYHEADDLNKVPPRFPRNFKDTLTKAMKEALSPTELDVEEDRDMGAWFVRARGLSERPFFKDLAIKACETLHKAMGGKD